MRLAIPLIGLLVLPLHILPAQARGGSAIVTPNFTNPLSSSASPNFANPLSSVAPRSTVGSLPVGSGMSPNNGLVPLSTSPIVPPIQPQPTVTTKVLTNTGSGTFTVTTVPQTGGVFTFSNGAMTSVNGNVLAPSVVTPQHDMTQSKVIVFQ